MISYVCSLMQNILSVSRDNWEEYTSIEITEKWQEVNFYVLLP